jgi:peptidoglycan hydrolase CwlO-like protein
LDGDLTSLQRELQEKELDIVHLRKEIQELQVENKLLKSKAPSVYSNSYTNV